MTDKSLTRRYRLITAFFISLASIAPAFASENALTILLTNDDGYLSPGIRAMRQALLDQGHEVFMVAPAETKAVAQRVFHRMASPLRITGLTYGVLGGVQQTQFASVSVS